MQSRVVLLPVHGMTTSGTRNEVHNDLFVIHYDGVIMSAIASQITSLTIVCSAFYSYADQRKHQSSASLAFVRGIHQGPVNSPHKWPVTRKMFPFDDVIMLYHDRPVRNIHSWTHFQDRSRNVVTHPEHEYIAYLVQVYRWLVQERRNSSALAIELHLSCTNPSIWLYPHTHGLLIQWMLRWKCTLCDYRYLWQRSRVVKKWHMEWKYILCCSPTVEKNKNTLFFSATWAHSINISIWFVLQNVLVWQN